MVNPDLSVSIGPLRLKNPVMTASGTFGYGIEFEPYLDLGELGGIVVKACLPGPASGTLRNGSSRPPGHAQRHRAAERRRRRLL